MKIVLSGEIYEMSAEDYHNWREECILIGNAFLQLKDGKAKHLPYEEVVRTHWDIEKGLGIYDKR